MADTEKKENIVKLQDVKTTDKEPQTTTVTTEPRNITTTVTHGLSPEDQARDAQEAVKLAESRGIDPKSGDYVGPIGNLLGFDPDRFKAQQEADERLERFKQKESGWANALGVIIDAATAAGGGDVYQRKQDDLAGRAKEKADKARDNVYALGGQIQKAKDAHIKQWQADEQKRQQDFYNKYKQTITKQEIEGGTKTTDKTGGTVTVTNNKEQQPKSGGGSGSGSKTDKIFVVNVTGDNGAKTKTEFKLSKAEYDAVARTLERRYTEIINQVGENGLTEYAKNSRKLMQQEGVLTFDKSGNPKFNLDTIMSFGEFYDLTDEDKKYIEQATGGKVKFKPKKKTFGKVGGTPAAEDEYDF